MKLVAWIYIVFFLKGRGEIVQCFVRGERGRLARCFISLVICFG